MTPQRAKIQFEPNTPVTVTLRFPDGRIVDGRFGQQVYYSVEGPGGQAAMYLDIPVAQKLNLLEVQPGESVSICKRWNGQKGQPVRWDVWLSPETEKTRAARATSTEGRTLDHDPERHHASLGTQLVRSITHVNEERYQGQRAPEKASQPAASPHTTNTGKDITATRRAALVDEANALVDVFAEVMERALTMYGGRVKPDEVRNLVVTAYIQKSRGSSVA